MIFQLESFDYKECPKVQSSDQLFFKSIQHSYSLFIDLRTTCLSLSNIHIRYLLTSGLLEENDDEITSFTT
jgi:hypothetical protein